MKWTQRNCIICGLVIFAIILTMYLFRHYTLIEGFDFSMPSTSSITSPLPSTSSITSSLPSIPSMSSSNWGTTIGPLPADNVVLPETIAKIKQIYTDNKLTGFNFQPENASQYVTEAEAQDFIKNLKWTWPDQMITCLKDFVKQNSIDEAAKAGKPAPTSEELAKIGPLVDDMSKSIPARSYAPMLFFMKAPCVKDLKESIFYMQLQPDRGAAGQKVLDKLYKVDDNKYLACGSDGPLIASWNSTTNTVDSTPTKYSEFPTLVKGFSFITPVADFAICDGKKMQKSAFSLDGSVSPFYQSFWGVPSGSSSSTFGSSSSTFGSSSSPFGFS